MKKLKFLLNDDKELLIKLENLICILEKYRSAVIAFSAGIDSSVLLAVTSRYYDKNRLIAITGDSDSITRDDIDLAKQISDDLKIEHRLIKTDEMKDPRYLANDENRCYFCKKDLYSHLDRIKNELNFDIIFDGTNLDDLKDHRPGRIAAEEYAVLSPFVLVKINKADIRKLANALDLKNKNKPEAACLSSRIRRGTAIDSSSLEKIEKSEKFIKSLGFDTVRVRFNDTNARIELAPDRIKKFFDDGAYNKVDSYLKTLGIKTVSLDLAGYKKGGAN